MHRRFVVLLAAAAWWLASAATASAQLSVGQLVTQLRPSAGEASLVIDVRNDGAAAVDVDVAVNDWEVDADGRHHFTSAGTLSDSCDGRLRVTASAIRIEAGATVGVRVAYVGAAGDRCRNIIFFRVTERPATLEGDRLIVSTGVKVYVEP